MTNLASTCFTVSACVAGGTCTVIAIDLVVACGIMLTWITFAFVNVYNAQSYNWTEAKLMAVCLFNQTIVRAISILNFSNPQTVLDFV